MIMQAIAVCCVKQSSESVLESLVLQYENCFNSNRNMEENHIEEEFFISVNGPNLALCNSVLEEAMDKYWKQKDWHFYRTSLSDHLKDFDGDSKVLNRFFSEKSKLPFMEHWTRTLIWGSGVYIHKFMFYPTSFFSNQIQISQFKNKSVWQNTNNNV